MEYDFVKRLVRKPSAATVHITTQTMDSESAYSDSIK
jgi:hypothetical protein